MEARIAGHVIPVLDRLCDALDVCRKVGSYCARRDRPDDFCPSSFELSIGGTDRPGKYGFWITYPVTAYSEY